MRTALLLTRRTSWIAALLSCVLLAPAARALMIELGPVSAGDIVGDQRIVPSAGGPTPFSDVWTFSLTDDLLSGVVVDVQTPTLLVALQIDSVSSTSFSFDEVEPGSAFSFLGDLAEGSYSFTVTGSTVGSEGGAYQVTVAAVPEPGAAALLCVALALCAAVRGRRLD